MRFLVTYRPELVVLVGAMCRRLPEEGMQAMAALMVGHYAGTAMAACPGAERESRRRPREAEQVTADDIDE